MSIFKPSFQVKFNPSKTKEIIQGLLKKKLKEEEENEKELGIIYYTSEKMADISKDVSKDIKEELKTMFPRYKLVVNTMVIHIKGQGLKFGFRSYWDEGSDGYASESAQNKCIWIVTTVFASYLY